jgi:hypothetical protein
MAPSLDSNLSKVKVSTGNTQADAILEQVRSLPTAGDLAAHFYRMHRAFEAKHKAELMMSDNGMVNQKNVDSAPTTLAPAESSAKDIDGGSDEAYDGSSAGVETAKNERPGM